MNPNILYIVPTDYDDLVKKGVSSQIIDRDEGGFFSSVLTLHPFTKTNKIIEISPKSRIIQYGWKLPNVFLNRFIITKLFGTCRIIFKLLLIFPRLIRENKINVIRSTDPYYCGLLGLYYSWLFKLPFVVSIHSDYDKNYEKDPKHGSFTILGSRKLAKKLEKFILSKSDAILPISIYLKEKYKNQYCLNEEKFVVFRHGINLELFDSCNFIDIFSKFEIPANKKLLSFVGRLTKENHIYDVIEMGKRLHQKNNDFILLIVGGGLEYDNIVNLTKTYPFIKLLGFQEREIVINVNRQSYLSICLLSGFSLIEACSGRNSIITYNIEWHKELIKNNVSGFILEEGDIDGAVDSMNYLLQNPEINELYGSNSRKEVEQKHSLDIVNRNKHEFYNSLLNQL